MCTKDLLVSCNSLVGFPIGIETQISLLITSSLVIFIAWKKLKDHFGISIEVALFYITSSIDIWIFPRFLPSSPASPQWPECQNINYNGLNLNILQETRHYAVYNKQADLDSISIGNPPNHSFMNGNTTT